LTLLAPTGERMAFYEAARQARCIALGFATGLRPQARLRSCQIKLQGRAECVVGAGHPLEPFAGRVMPELGLCIQLARRRFRLLEPQRRGTAEGQSAVLATQRILEDVCARAARSHSQAEAWNVVVKHDESLRVGGSVNASTVFWVNFMKRPAKLGRAWQDAWCVFLLVTAFYRQRYWQQTPIPQGLLLLHAHSCILQIGRGRCAR
jgi:hypothetical protein